ncbi:MAG: GspMb/PilO family protein [Pseudomonadota bacterium]
MTSRFEKISAVAILLVGLVLMGLFVVEPIWALRQDVARQVERETEQQRDLAARLLTLVAEDDRLSSSIPPSIGWEGSRIGEVSARIQSAITASARRLGLQLRSVTAIETEPLAGQQTAGLRIELEAPSDVAMTFMRSVEATEPPLMITRANLRRVNRNAPGITQPFLYLRLELTAPVRISG